MVRRTSRSAPPRSLGGSAPPVMTGTAGSRKLSTGDCRGRVPPPDRSEDRYGRPPNRQRREATTAVGEEWGCDLAVGGDRRSAVGPAGAEAVEHPATGTRSDPGPRSPGSPPGLPRRRRNGTGTMLSCTAGITAAAGDRPGGTGRERPPRGSLDGGMTGSRRKALGAYYTPPAVAAALVGWAVRRPEDRLLDPACGDGRFLALHPRSTGVDRDETAARAAAEAAPGSVVHRAEFFEWALSTRERFECAAGNPPFIRYQRFAGAEREARAAPRRLGGGRDLGTRLLLGAVSRRRRFPAAPRRPHGVRGSRRNRPRPLRRAGPFLVRGPLRGRAGDGDPGKTVPRALGGCLAAVRGRLRRPHGIVRTLGRGPFRRPLSPARRNRGSPAGLAAFPLPAAAIPPPGPRTRRIPAPFGSREHAPAWRLRPRGGRLCHRRQRLLPSPPDEGAPSRHPRLLPHPDGPPRTRSEQRTDHGRNRFRMAPTGRARTSSSGSDPARRIPPGSSSTSIPRPAGRRAAATNAGSATRGIPSRMSPRPTSSSPP